MIPDINQDTLILLGLALAMLAAAYFIGWVSGFEQGTLRERAKSLRAHQTVLDLLRKSGGI